MSDRPLPMIPVESPPARRRRLVLVVDDDHDITRMLETLLAKLLPVDVMVAHGAFGVLNLIAERRPDAVLLDVMMPGLDGSAVTALIRADEDLAHTRVVLYSALPLEALRARTEACGADAFVQKGTRPTEIARTLQRWWDSTPPPDAGTAGTAGTTR